MVHGDSIETHRPEIPSSPVSLVIDIQEHSSEPSLVAHPQGTETQLETLNLGDRPQDLEAVSAASDEERLVKIHNVIQQLPPPHYRSGLKQLAASWWPELEVHGFIK